MQGLHAKRSARSARTILMAILVAALVVPPVAPAWASTPAIVAKGVVTNATTHAPLAGAHVVATYHEGATGEYVADELTTGADGTYIMHDTYAYGAGMYSIAVSAPGYVNGNHGAMWDGVNALTVDFPLAVAKAIATGTVTAAADASPIAGAQVTAEYREPMSGMWISAGFATTAGNGSYAVYDLNGAGAGSYRISANARGYVTTGTIAAWNGTSTVTANLAMTAAKQIATGTVTESGSGTPLAGARVWAEVYDTKSGDWLAADDASTTVAGGFVLFASAGSPPGTYRFHAVASGHALQTQSASWNGTETLNVEFALPKLLPLAAGTVTATSTGVPIAGAHVLLEFHDADSGDWWRAGEAVTAANGTYSFSPDAGYGAGEYRLSAMANAYKSQLRTSTWNGSTPIAADFSLIPRVPCGYVSLAGANRYETAVLVSKDAFPTPGSAKAVVIATGGNWPDALGASALAGAYDAPVLLTPTASLLPTVAAEITRLGVKKAFIIGSDKAVSLGVEAAVAQLVGGTANVKRLQGGDRYATASAVAAEVKTRMTALGRWDGRVVVATGRNFPDALAASPLSAHRGIPILLTPDTLPQTVKDRLAALAPTQIVVLGSSKSVSTAAETALLAYAPTKRVWGVDRYETGVKVVDYGVSSAGLTWEAPTLATGQNFPDALAGGAASGMRGSVVLLTPGTYLYPLVDTALTTHKADVTTLRFLGGTSTITDTVRTSVKTALQ